MSVLKGSLPRLSVRDFTWTGRVGVVEASTLGPSFEPGRVYDDAIDEGFVVVGLTKDVVFALHIQVGPDDDAPGAWVYRSINDRTGRGDDRYEIHILND